MAENLTDEEIVALVQTGDSGAFGHIVKRWERKIYALCYGMLGNQDDAKDATQDAFIAAFRNLGNFRGEAKVSSWLHRIAVNQCLTKKRRVKTRAESSIDDEDSPHGNEMVASDVKSPLQTVEMRERQRLVSQAVSSLPIEMRQIILMKEYEEMTFQEISDALQIPLSTVKSRLYTGLKQLRMKLERTPVEIG